MGHVGRFCGALATAHLACCKSSQQARPSAEDAAPYPAMRPERAREDDAPSGALRELEDGGHVPDPAHFGKGGAQKLDSVTRRCDCGTCG